MSDVQLQHEIGQLMQQLRAVGDEGRKASKAAFGDAAGLLVSAIQGRAPRSERPHYRYSTPKIGKRSRAPKGSGVKVATYMPGNLSRSFRILPFRRSPAVWVGPKLAKGAASGVFAGLRSDAYYGAMVEYGTRKQSAKPFVRPAVSAAGSTTLRLAAANLKQELDKFIKRKSL